LEARVSVEVDAEAPFGFKREEAPGCQSSASNPIKLH